MADLPDEHERLRLLLGTYVLGGLSAAEIATVERHLARCADCSADADSLIEVLFALALLSGEEDRELTDE